MEAITDEMSLKESIQVAEKNERFRMSNVISIADFARQKRTFTYKSELGDMQVTYRPYQMTPAREAEITRIAADAMNVDEDTDVQETDKGLSKIVQNFCEVVEAIGIVGPLHERTNPRTGAGEGRLIVKAGEPVPIETEVVKYFSSVFIINILEAVGKDSRPKSNKMREISPDIS